MYHEISFDDFDRKMTEVGAHRMSIPGTFEAVYEIPIRTKSGCEFPENVRIYSSIGSGGHSRGKGKDAIRVCLVRDGRILISTKRVNRSAKPDVVIERVVQRAREAFKYAMNPENRGPSGHLFTKGRVIG